METEVLRWFQHVADGVTVTDVSEIHRVSQPTVSRALHRLEVEAGAPLLYRSGRTLRLTHAGRVFKRHVDAIVHNLDDAMAAVAQVLDPQTGTVTISVQPSLGTWLLPDLIGSYRRDHPGVRFDLRSKTDERITMIGAHSDVDLELSTLRPDREASQWFGLAVEPIRLLVHRTSPFHTGEQIRIVDLRDEPFIVMRSTSLLRDQTEMLCRQAGFEPQVAFVADDLPTVRGYVAAGLGLALVPSLWEPGDEPPTAGIRYLELADDDAYREVGLSWSKRRRMLPAAQSFRAHTRERRAAGKLPRPRPVSGPHPGG